MALNRGFNRTKISNKNGEDDGLLVFGYSATLHNQAETTGELFDEDKYLIPWNGDEQLKIDRYDARLYLSSLEEFKGHKMSLENKRKDDDDGEENSAEKLEEELCEEQRYTDLYLEMRKKEIEEEEEKRAKRAEIGYSYDQQDDAILDVKIKENDEEPEEDEPYKKPESLKLPFGIFTPETMRQNALIERTAAFVVSQGPQMEVVIKAKQRQKAEQFAFLDFDHRLHPYYKYLCKLIREKKYKPAETTKIAKKRQPSPPSSSGSETDSEAEDGYLHPLLRGEASNNVSREPGFIGPMAKPAQQKAHTKKESKDPDLDALVQQFHRSANQETSIYSSLMKGLHSVLPGNITEKVEKKAEDETVAIEPKKVEEMIEVETDNRRIEDYNKWHMEFYGRPSPYLPGPPPIPQTPLPDSAVESGITVAAKYVALHGAAAEQRLIEHNGDKVHFLLARSPYYTFYQSCVRQLQWQILHQQQISHPVAAPFPAVQLNKQILPLTIHQNLELDSQGMRGTTSDEIKNEEDEKSTDNKQQERKEKARLFMERILNERLAEKNISRRTRFDEKSGLKTKGKLKEKSKGFDDDEPIPSTSTILTPSQLSKTISTLIDQQIQKTLAIPSPATIKRGRRSRVDGESSSNSSDNDEKEYKKQKRRKNEEEEKYNKDSRRHKRERKERRKRSRSKGNKDRKSRRRHSSSSSFRSRSK